MPVVPQPPGKAVLLHLLVCLCVSAVCVCVCVRPHIEVIEMTSSMMSSRTLRHFEWQNSTMVKSCVAVGCSNRSEKGSKLSFYRFPADSERRLKWIAALQRKNWKPTQYSWVCSAHFVSGAKSNDPLSPDYVPSVFKHVTSPVKRRKTKELDDYCRRKRVRTSRLDALRSESARQEAATALLELNDQPSGDQPTGTSTQTEALSTCCVQVQTDLSAQIVCKYEEQCQHLQNEKSRQLFVQFNN